MTTKNPLFVPSNGNIGGKDLLSIEKRNHKMALSSSKPVLRISTPKKHVNFWKTQYMKEIIPQPLYFTDPSTRSKSYKLIPKGVDVSQPNTMKLTHLKLRKKNNRYAADNHNLNILALTRHLGEIDQNSKKKRLKLKAEKRGVSLNGKHKKTQKRVWKIPYPDGYEDTYIPQKSANKKSKKLTISTISQWKPESRISSANPLSYRSKTSLNSQIKSHLYKFIVENEIKDETQLVNLENEALWQYPNLDRKEINEFFDEMITLVKLNN